MRWCYGLLIALTLVATGCSKEEKAPPPGVSDEVPDLDVDMGEPFDSGDQSTTTDAGKDTSAK